MDNSTDVTILRQDELMVLKNGYIQCVLAESPKFFRGEYGVYSAQVVMHGNLIAAFIGPYVGEADSDLLTDMYQRAGKRYLKLKL